MIRASFHPKTIIFVIEVEKEVENLKQPLPCCKRGFILLKPKQEPRDTLWQ